MKVIVCFENNTCLTFYDVTESERNDLFTWYNSGEVGIIKFRNSNIIVTDTKFSAISAHLI